MSIFLFSLLAAFLVSGIPIFIALSSCVLVSFMLFSQIPLETVVMRMFAGLDKFSLMSIPFFILAANIMSAGGISRRIIALAKALVGSMHGGMAITTIIACLFFGAISGSSPATVVAIGALLYPAMCADGYPKSFSSGLITSAGSLGIVIPPSVNMIVYGAITGVSVGALFVSGFGAGLLFGLALMIYAYIKSRRTPNIVLHKKASSAELIAAIKDSSLGLGVPVIILGGIYGGVFTPTESAAVAVVYAMIVSLFIYRELNSQEFIKTVITSAVTTAQVMIVLAAASVFAWILTAEGITSAIAKSMLAISQNPYILLMMINIVLLIVGMFIDGASIITILAPLFYPITVKAGIDPIHLGIIMVVNSAIGMFTPPFGLNLFVATGVCEQPLSEISKGIMPFILVSIGALLLITYVPEISLWLPKLVYGAW